MNIKSDAILEQVYILVYVKKKTWPSQQIAYLCFSMFRISYWYVIPLSSYIDTEDSQKFALQRRLL